MIYTEKGKISRLFDEEKRTSKQGNEYPFRAFVVETQDNGFTDDLYFEVVGQEVEDTWKLKEGEAVEVRYKPQSREYNGKWYVRLRLFGIKSIEEVKAPAPAPKVEDEGNDLPF